LLEKSVSFCGRVLTASELILVRQIIADFPRLSQAELAHTICELLDWRRPNGKLKSPECLDWLRKLEQHNRLPELPQLRLTKPRGAHRFQADPQSDPQPPVCGPLSHYQPLQLQLVADLADRRLFQQYIQRYHPLGYRVPYGAQLRYLVRGRTQEVLGCLLFTSAAWKMAPRDGWIGWSDAARRANLALLVNNGRFLILPWVRVPHLASHILALAARQFPCDWLSTYAVRPVLLETLVDRPYAGTLLPRGQLDLRGPEPGPRPDGSYPSGSGQRQRHSVVPAGARLAPAPMPTAGTIPPPCSYWRSFMNGCSAGAPPSRSSALGNVRSVWHTACWPACAPI